VTSPFPPPADPSTATPAEPSAARRSLGCLFEVVETLVLTVVIFFVIQTFVAQPYQVRQQSMERTLEPNEYVLVDKLTPRWDDYKRGDIVVFEPPEGWSLDGDRTPFIKRVIGESGDVVELRDGRVLINGTAVDLDDPVR
jgi:signal peptidase I